MTTFVLFGGTGDLAKRKIIPALYSAFVNGRLDPEFSFIGAAREALSDEDFRKRVATSIETYAAKANGTKEQLAAFLNLVGYTKIDAKNPEDFEVLKSRVSADTSKAKLFYII